MIKTIKELNQTNDDFETSRRIINKYSVIDECIKIAKYYVDEAIISLNEFPQNKYKSALNELAISSLKRKNEI